MIALDAAIHQDSKRASFVHVTLRSLDNTKSLERYVHKRVDRQSKKGPEVLWYEVVVSETKYLQRGPFLAHITAHLRGNDVFVSRSADDGLLAVRAVFDALAQRLWRVRDVCKSRAHGALSRSYSLEYNSVVH